VRAALVSVLVLAALVAAACGSNAGGQTGGGKLQVVAAENFWGSLATQLGGDKVHVTSIVHNPGADPHDYEPTPADARTMAGAKLAIVNGIGYDPWAPKLLSANPVSGRVVLTVGDVVGIKDGGNPHRWYSPTNVQQVIDAIVADYEKLDPDNAGYFDQQKAKVENQALARYGQLIASIKHSDSGVPVGASESIFEPLAQGLGLKLLTPAGYMNAVSEGTDPTAADRAAVDQQIRSKQIKLWVYNSQNATPDVKRLTSEARAAGIPVVTVTETPEPASASFQDWQVRQLEEIAKALA
jgi:zinc/manganese transport system substrate-binding protein